MKRAIIVWICLLLTMGSYAQRITLSVENRPIREVLSLIEQNSP